MWTPACWPRWPRWRPQYSFRVTGFGDASPGVPVLFREVSITGVGRGLAAALAMIRAQNPPYLPAHAAAVGQTGLSIEFAAPGPLGCSRRSLTLTRRARPRPAAHFLWGGHYSDER